MKIERQTSGANSEHWGSVGSPSDVAALFNSVKRDKDSSPWRVYDFAVKNGLREPAPNPWDFNRPAFTKSIKFMNMPSPATMQIGATLKNRPRGKIGIDWANLQKTPEALKYQSSWNYYKGEPNGEAVELARLVVPKNEIGVITCIKTGLTFEPNDITWPMGDIAWFERDLAPDVGQAKVTWFLKYENNGDTAPDTYGFRVVNTPACIQAQIPGTEHPDFPGWNKMLYPWCCDNHVYIFIPSNHTVSLWINFHEHFSPWGVRDCAGMLKGFTQIQGSWQTFKNVTRGMF